MAIALGIDLGTSCIKLSLVRDDLCELATQSYPDDEAPIDSPHPGWAEQTVESWIDSVKHALARMRTTHASELAQVTAIGISYQMHGLVVIGREGKPLRPSIIWCDTRAVESGAKLGSAVGESYWQPCLLNHPGNFTASKLAWVQAHEPEIASNISCICLPGDAIAAWLSGTVQTTATGLSEMILWDYASGSVSQPMLDVLGAVDLVPELVPAIGHQSQIRPEIANELGLNPKAIITYRAGDQPNNAFSLGANSPGQIAATAGTSGVIYSVSDAPTFDESGRSNTFVHVTSKPGQLRLGSLVCINGCGIQYAWLRRNIMPPGASYEEMSHLASSAPVGAAGLNVYPFGNGAERCLGNRFLGAWMGPFDFLRLDRAHVLRAALEGIAFAMRYGAEHVPGRSFWNQVKAGRANLFLSPVFAQTFADLLSVEVSLLDSTGSKGAALGALVGAKAISLEESERANAAHTTYHPDTKRARLLESRYSEWKSGLAGLSGSPD